MELISVELSPTEAEAFREFMQLRDMLTVLTDSGVFTTKNGQAILNFNADGVLTDIDFHVKGYKRARL
jgi:hypothetical protein